MNTRSRRWLAPLVSLLLALSTLAGNTAGLTLAAPAKQKLAELDTLMLRAQQCGKCWMPA